MPLEILEGLGYFAAFWTFIFSNDFRASLIDEYRAEGRGGRFMLLFQAFIATLIGVFPVVVALVFVLELITSPEFRIPFL